MITSTEALQIGGVFLRVRAQVPLIESTRVY